MMVQMPPGGPVSSVVPKRPDPQDKKWLPWVAWGAVLAVAALMGWMVWNGQFGNEPLPKHTHVVAPADQFRHAVRNAADYDAVPDRYIDQEGAAVCGNLVIDINYLGVGFAHTLKIGQHDGRTVATAFVRAYCPDRLPQGA